MRVDFMRHDGIPVLWTVFTNPRDVRSIPMGLFAAAADLRARARESVWLMDFAAGTMIFCLMDLNARRLDVEGFVHLLEDWIINSLQQSGVNAARDVNGADGIWLNGRQIGTITSQSTKWVMQCKIDLNVHSGIAAVLRSQFELLFGPTSLVEEQS